MVLPERPAIPYRADTPVATGELAWAMTAVAAALVVLVLLAVVLRRRGLLRGLPGGLRGMPEGDVAVHALASRRLSRATTVHLVEADGVRYLITESVRACAMHPVRPGSEPEDRA